MKKSLTLIALAIFLFIACVPTKNEDVVKEPSKEGAIEAKITTVHMKGFDILSTQFKVWVKGKLDTVFYSNQKIKSLGITTAEYDSTFTAKDEDGEKYEDVKTKKAIVPKDYEFYITVK